MNPLKLCVGKDGSIIVRRWFRGGWIALQRLQFSSSEGIAYAISAERTPQVIVYEERYGANTNGLGDVGDTATRRSKAENK